MPSHRIRIRKLDFESQFIYVKNYPNLSQFFFSLKNINLGANFLLLTFFDNINFWIISFSKMMPNFWHLPINPILKIQQFPLSILIRRQKSSNLLPPVLKLRILYCHSIWISSPEKMNYLRVWVNPIKKVEYQICLVSKNYRNF